MRVRASWADAEVGERYEGGELEIQETDDESDREATDVAHEDIFCR